MKPRFSAMNLSKFFFFADLSAFLPPKVDILTSNASIVRDILLINAGSFWFVKQFTLLLLTLLAFLWLTS